MKFSPPSEDVRALRATWKLRPETLGRLGVAGFEVQEISGIE